MEKWIAKWRTYLLFLFMYDCGWIGIAKVLNRRMPLFFFFFFERVASIY